MSRLEQRKAINNYIDRGVRINQMDSTILPNEDPAISRMLWNNNGFIMASQG